MAVNIDKVQPLTGQVDDDKSKYLIEDHSKHLQRVATYEKWSNHSISALKLAKAYFYYTGTDDSVKCSVCGLIVNEWKSGQDPLKEHQQRSPNCPLFKGQIISDVSRDEKANTDLGYVSGEGQPLKVLLNNKSECVQQQQQLIFSKDSSVHTSNSPKHVNFNDNSTRTDRQPQSEGNKTVNREILQNNDLAVRSSNLTFNAIRVDSDQNIPEHSSNVVTPSLSRTTTLNNYVSKPLTSKENLVDMALLRTMDARLNTFISWPKTAKANPLALAKAGLFYTKINDRVQCPFCHGILYNWIEQDIPIEQHAKHFPYCSFIQQTLKEEKTNMQQKQPQQQWPQQHNPQSQSQQQNWQQIQQQHERLEMVQKLRQEQSEGQQLPHREIEQGEMKKEALIDAREFERKVTCPGAAAASNADIFSLRCPSDGSLPLSKANDRRSLTSYPGRRIKMKKRGH